MNWLARSRSAGRTDVRFGSQSDCTEKIAWRHIAVSEFACETADRRRKVSAECIYLIHGYLKANAKT